MESQALTTPVRLCLSCAFCIPLEADSARCCRSAQDGFLLCHSGLLTAEMLPCSASAIVLSSVRLIRLLKPWLAFLEEPAAEACALILSSAEP